MVCNICPAGSYCTGGVKTTCPAGTLGNAVNVLGAYNIGPWNMASIANINAKWIWNSASAQSSVPGIISITQ